MPTEGGSGDVGNPGGAGAGTRRGAGAGEPPGAPVAVPGNAPVVAAVYEAGLQLRAPWAASVAGLLFAILFTAGVALLRASPLLTATDAEIARLMADGEDAGIIVGGLYLAPFAGVMFLWFLAVVRDQVGEREDRFFSTVFLGSGLLFVAMLFVAAAVAGAIVVGVRYLGQEPPSAATVGLMRALSYTLLFAFGTRAAAVFVISTATISLRSRAFPTWVAWTGYVIGIVLFLVVTFWDWIVLVLPAWVAVVSLFTLRRERLRRRRARALGRPPGPAG